MSKLSARLGEPLLHADWDSVIDHIYLLIKEEDKLEEENKSLKTSLYVDIDLIDYLRRDLRELKKKLKLELMWAERE